MIEYQGELYHFGIKRRSGRYPYGSGERPYQSESYKGEFKDIDKALKGKERSDRRFNQEHIIPAGTTMYRATLNKDEKMGGATYVTYLQPDRDLYRGGAIINQNGKTGNETVYEMEFKLKEPLKIPSKNVVKATINEIIEDNPKSVRNALDNFVKVRFNMEMQDMDSYGYTKEDKAEFKKWYKECAEETWSKSINDPDAKLAFMTGTLGTNTSLKNDIIKILSDKGYNAMHDFASIGGVKDMQNVEGIEPLIIFNAQNSLSKQSSNIVDETTRSRASQEYMRWKANVNRDNQKWKKTGRNW